MPKDIYKLTEQLIKDFNPQDHMSGEPLPGIELISTPEPEQQYWWYDRTGSTMTEEWKAEKAINMQGNSNRPTKQYIIEQPDGTRELITNMAKYCKEHNLQASNLNKTLTGIRNYHKGYKAYDKDSNMDDHPVIERYLKNEHRQLPPHNKGKKGLWHPNEEQRQKMSDAKKGKAPWNKGLKLGPGGTRLTT